MIDLHCHLLPGIDDGAKNLDAALSMARLAVNNGIDHAVMTPHINPGRYSNSRSSIEGEWRGFARDLREAGIPLQTSFAAEVRIAPEVLAMLAADEIPFLGEIDGYRVMLLEFPHSHIPPGSATFVEELLRRRIRPLIAHPERNKEVMRNTAKVERLAHMGCLLQLTAGSLAGSFGRPARLCALQLVSHDACFAIASDAHNLKARIPDLRAGFKVALTIVGKKRALELVEGNPRMLVGRGGSMHQLDAAG